MKKHRSLRFLMVVLVAGQLGLDLRPVEPVLGLVEVPAGVRVMGGGPEAVRLVDWVVERFAAAGLWLPLVDVRVHDSKAGCDGHLALTRDQTDRTMVEVCTSGQGREVADRVLLLHEFGHVWVGANVDEETRVQFMELHGLSVWWDAAEGWERQGNEWAAETIAWAVFDEGVRLIGEVKANRERLGAGFVLLTGLEVPTGGHDHSLVERAMGLDELSDSDADSGTGAPSPSGRSRLTLTQFTRAWERAVGERGLPVGIGDWTSERGGSLAVTQVTSQVRLVASVSGNGSVRGVSLVAGGHGLYDRYDTVLAWSLMLEVFCSDGSVDIWAGLFDHRLHQVGDEIRGHMHLAGRPGDGTSTAAHPHSESAGVLS